MLQFLDYIGVFVFAATGAIAASRKRLDIIGFLFLATLTGVGGGTFRDIVLGVPVFWVKESQYIVVCTSAAIIVFFTAHLFESRYRLLLWLDAMGLAAYCVMGAAKALSLGVNPTIAVVMGGLTATFGGILRDIIANEPSVLMRREIYVTSALMGAICFVAASVARVPSHFAMAVGVIVAFTIRGGAIQFGWSLPSYKARIGRNEDELKKIGVLRSDDE